MKTDLNRTSFQDATKIYRSISQQNLHKNVGALTWIALLMGRQTMTQLENLSVDNLKSYKKMIHNSMLLNSDTHTHTYT